MIRYTLEEAIELQKEKIEKLQAKEYWKESDFFDMRILQRELAKLEHQFDNEQKAKEMENSDDILVTGYNCFGLYMKKFRLGDIPKYNEGHELFNQQVCYWEFVKE